MEYQKNKLHHCSVAAVDDEPEMRVQIRNALALYAEKYNIVFHIELFGTAEELLDRYEQEEVPFQILILDVELPGMSGVEAAQQIRQWDPEAVIIFLTAYDAYALDAYGVNAIGYLLKPVERLALWEKVSMSLSWLRANHIQKEENMQQTHLVVTNHYQKIQIELSEIIYIEKHRNHCRICCHHTEYICYTSLYRLYQQLPTPQFCYCHQGYIVNFSKVLSVGKTELLMENGILVPVSRRYYKMLHQRKIEEVVQYQEPFWTVEPKTEELRL